MKINVNSVGFIHNQLVIGIQWMMCCLLVHSGPSLVVEVFLRVLFITYSDGSKTKNPKTMEHVLTNTLGEIMMALK